MIGFEIELPISCTDGDVRLTGGSETNGTIEVCHENQWGLICSSGFGTNEAKVICQQLKFPTSGKNQHSPTSTHHFVLTFILQGLLPSLGLLRNLIQSYDLFSSRCCNAVVGKKPYWTVLGETLNPFVVAP